MRCRRCGYDLRDLQEHRCPECGRPFDPKRPATWLSEPISGRKNLVAANVAAALFIIPLALGVTEDLRAHFLTHEPTATRIAVLLLVGPVLIIMAVTVEAAVLWTSSMVLLNRRPWVTDRTAFYATLPISLAVFVYFIAKPVYNAFF